jgi:hypothetical protein
MPGVDVWTVERDATKYAGENPVVAHPPCRAWGRLRRFANPGIGERGLALFAVDQVRRCGGVLEHPYKSTLWDEAGLPNPSQRDAWNGWTIAMPQWWFGHRAEKASWFYIVGVEPGHLPAIPLRLGEPAFVIATRKKGHSRRPEVSKRERELTPPLLAEWLVEVARRTERKV